MSTTPETIQASTELPAFSISRWIPVGWGDLPGFSQDDLMDVWNAWLKSCERPAPAFVHLCPDIRRLSIASSDERRFWMMLHLQPYRVVSEAGQAEGLLTAYYEPLLHASRVRTPQFPIPLYAPPQGLTEGNAWYTRQQIDTKPHARMSLNGRELAYLTNPIDAMILHIQGSGRLYIRETDGSVHLVRMAYAATNGQPYKSIGRWLLERKLINDASWEGIRDWADRNPARLSEMLWSNPRYVFFREESLSTQDAEYGPRGAQGVSLTPGRSIAVDRRSIPYGTPVWLVTKGAAGDLQRLVLAQDTGSAIKGAVRADYFVGWGRDAGQQAGRFKQSLQLWALWPKPPAEVITREAAAATNPEEKPAGTATATDLLPQNPPAAVTDATPLPLAP